MADEASLMNMVADLLSTQAVAVLATQHDGQPYTSLMAFAASADCRRLYFATLKSTRKFANMAANPRVALLLDNRGSRVADFLRIQALTATGWVEEVLGPERDRALQLYLAKNPSLREFAVLPDCALLQLRVERYFLVSNFGEVQEWRL
jgi:heme iron utilization protein